MQLAGEQCCICKQNVLFDPDATWCARCSVIFHRSCIGTADGICPTCRKTYERPESCFAFSRFCPECMQPNQPASARCSACGAVTRWDTAADYQQFVEHMRSTSRLYQLQGWLELGLAVVCLGTFFLIFWLSSAGPILFLPGGILFAMFGLTAHGASRLRHGRAIRFFE